MFDKKIKNDLFYNSFGNIVYLVCIWLMSIIIVKVSGYEAAGILSLCILFSNVLNAIGLYGMRGFQTSDLKKEFNDYTYLRSRYVTIFVGYLLTAIFLILSKYSVDTTLCVLFYMILKISEIYVDVLHGTIQKYGSMKRIGISYMCRGLIIITLFSLGLLILNNLLLTIILIDIFVLIFILLYDYKNYKSIVEDIKPKFDIKKIFKLLCVCFPLFLYTFMFNNIQLFPRYLLEKMTSTEILGIYSSIATPTYIIQCFATFLYTPFITVLTAYKNNNDIDKFNKTISKILLYIICFIIFCLIISLFFGKLGLKILFGSSILEYTYLLYSTIIVAGLFAIIYFLDLILTIKRNFKVLIYINILSLLISSVLSYFLIKKYEMIGINYTLIFVLVLQILVLIKYIYIKKVRCTND